MIIDFHAHLYPPSFKTRRDEIIRQDDTFALLFGNPKARIASAPELLLAMDKSNVDVTVALGLGWTSLNVAREANEYILRAAASSDDRLIPFCSVNPAWGQDAVLEIERCAARAPAASANSTPTPRTSTSPIPAKCPPSWTPPALWTS